ncbi:HD-GYP domain-containing protein [Thiohalophilus sp.]|uniref:HD-GYP domain-containing protein n=1 Tax=Thiohalophilus sp. TaxID=3028392 RepID=UPI002ACE0D1C|nr:HD domain-containing phosphohydrolase [Thiohalophilus sp.]MDZ7805374.1 HD domain-containing phosphohydrolase [Thiohalophilus sp.]
MRSRWLPGQSRTAAVKYHHYWPIPTRMSLQPHPMQPDYAPGEQLRLSEVIGALSYALDLTEGQPAGHCIRCCWIGMHLGRMLGMPQADLLDLYYTLLLKDAGCSSNAARLYQLYGGDERQIKNRFKTVDGDHLQEIARFVFENIDGSQGLVKKMRRFATLVMRGEKYADELVETRCERGADIARRLGFNETIADGIRHLDEHWNGHGRPYHIKGDQIPIHSRIALLSQVIDVFFQIAGQDAAEEEIHKRRGSWFDPELVDTFMALRHDRAFWETLVAEDIQFTIQNMAPESEPALVSDDRLDDITAAFGMIVDAKSPYTFDHSSRVASYTLAISEELSVDPARRHFLRRGAFLHDIGKLGVSNDILDKPGKLDDAEWRTVRDHARYTETILSHLTPFAELARVAGAHHERLDGGGYPYGLTAEEICLETRIITVADIFDAITAERPYRGPVPRDKAIEIMRGEVNTAVDEAVLDALVNRLPTL